MYDTRVQEKLEEISQRIGAGDPRTVNANLDYMNRRLDVKGEAYNPEAAGQGQGNAGNQTLRAEAPNFPNNSLLTGTIQKRRCGNSKTPDDQREVCVEIVKLEESRYQYLQAMRTISEKRSAELKAIYEERRNIREDEYGKLQSNTNRLLALLSQQRIDQLNMDMAMLTFDERMRDRKEYKDYLAQVAMDPTKKQGISITDVLGGFARFAILDQALEAARTQNRNQ